MLLAREEEIADLIAIAPQRFDHSFCLVWRHNGVLVSLEEDLLWGLNFLPGQSLMRGM